MLCDWRFLMKILSKRTQNFLKNIKKSKLVFLRAIKQFFPSTSWPEFILTKLEIISEMLLFWRANQGQQQL